MLNLQECPSSYADPVEWLTAMILRRRRDPSTRLVSSISDDKDNDDFAELLDPMSFYKKFFLSPYILSLRQKHFYHPFHWKYVSNIILYNDQRALETVVNRFSLAM